VEALATGRIMERPEFDDSLNKPRWVAWFDLLGVTELITRGEMFVVHDAYAKAVNEARAEKDVNTFWFSDTFVFFTESSDKADFVDINSTAQHFMSNLILRTVPARGAISAGLVYADLTHSIHFGPALIDAYRYAEGQDWLGLILTPEAVAHLKEIGMDPDIQLPHSYARWPVPFKQSAPLCATVCANRSLPSDASQQHPAARFPNCLPRCAQGLCRQNLQSMKTQASGNPRAETKYDNTLAFLSSKGEN
jgi:hypothetical protein